jgi:hypothetical protein
MARPLTERPWRTSARPRLRCGESQQRGLGPAGAPAAQVGLCCCAGTYTHRATSGYPQAQPHADTASHSTSRPQENHEECRKKGPLISGGTGSCLNAAQQSINQSITWTTAPTRTRRMLRWDLVNLQRRPPLQAWHGCAGGKRGLTGKGAVRSSALHMDV